MLSSCGEKTFDPQNFYGFPKYEKVVKKFSEKYTNPENTYIEFAKKPKGYYVLEKSIEDRSIKSEQLFWSKEQNKYLPLDDKFIFRPNGNSPYNTIEQSLIYNSYSFNHSLYYNYDEAHAESIAALEDVASLDDTLLECLARAYSGECLKIIEGTDASRKPFNAEQKVKFMEYSDKMIATYRRIEERNPKYQTLVGRVRTKRAHETVFTWWELQRSGFKEDGDKYLSADLYEGLYHSFARNMLASCPQNAILFTHGDGDTFPLWYVQEKENFRKDVAVINVSQINAAEYLKYYVQHHQLQTTIPLEKYSDAKTEVIFVQRQESPELNTSLELKDVLNGLKTGSSDYIYTTADNSFLKLPMPYLHIGISNPETQNDTTLLESVSLRYDRSSYLLRSDLLQLDLLLNYLGKRPVCVSSLGREQLNAHTPNTDNRMLVEEIVWHKFYGTGDFYGNVHDVQRNYDLLMKSYTYEGKYDEGYESDHIAINHIMAFNRTADLLFKAGDTAKTIQLCDKVLQVYPVDKMADLEFFLVGFAHHYAAAGMKKEAKKCLNYAVNSLEKTSKLAKSPEDFQSIRSRAVYMLEDVRNTGDQALIDRLQKINDKVIGQSPTPAF
jgi:hypothetical protein